ncbi:benzaldehyde dehydrogenase [Vreelandella nigrificans]|uniref:Benzaldehyde dehydrogenase n=1 Tax=Vreelandella nigrificans TaxID=2042704 RepID=A0A2A4HSB9_9GAMM|nr:benzaldehyde dehydrogenase [Halomonas nigrificans]PCF96981.1 benzaldehyde dehydrogenase [Halomonas nigrificans]
MKMLSDDILNGKYFNGQWVTGTEISPAIEPATGETLGQFAIADAAVMTSSAATARNAQRSWAAQPGETRSAIMYKAAMLMEEHREEISEWLIRESGSIKLKAAFEVEVSIKALRESAGLPGQSQGDILPSELGSLSLARRRPLGVVGVISPFNFPLYLAIRAVAPALAVGNGVVLKPDPRTAICGGLIIGRLLELAGAPEGILHVLPGGGETGAALVADPNVAMIQFTGSTEAGRKVGESAGRHLKKVSLELGGKNSLIVLDDADLDTAVSNAAWGSYLHQGQICMATGRILVHRKIHDEFVKRMVAKARNLKVGDPVQQDVAIGPIINEHQRDHIHMLVRSAVEAGATLEAGGNHENLFFEPTVLSNVSPDNPAYLEEIFGPVAVIVPFDDDEMAVRLANDTDYGLSAGIITRDVGRALQLSERIDVGLLHINDQTVNDDVCNPFGGTGQSGNGTSIGGPANWEEFTQWQWLTIKPEAQAYPI